MKVWNLTVKTVVKDGKVVKGRTRKQTIGKTSYGLTGLASQSRGGRWWQQAQSTFWMMQRKDKRWEKPFGSVELCYTELRKLTEPKKIFYYFGALRLWKFNPIKAKFPWWNTQFTTKPESAMKLCVTLWKQNECILWGRRVDCLYISIIFKCKPFSDFRSIIVFTMLPSIVK